MSKRSNAKPEEKQITLDTQLETVKKGKKNHRFVLT